MLLSNTIDATNPDLSAFRAKGGRILLMQGLDDPSVSPYANERVYLNIRARMGQAATDSFMRFYFVPGLAHGNGKYLINWDNLNILDSWVDNGVAPPAVPISVDGNVVTLGFPEGQAFLKDALERRRPMLEEGIGQFLGRAVAVRCVATNLPWEVHERRLAAAVRSSSVAAVAMYHSASHSVLMNQGFPGTLMTSCETWK